MHDVISAQRRIDGHLQTAISSGALPCIVACAADRDGIIYQGAFGEKIVGTGIPVELNTTFRIHSMTKTVTAVAAMQLVETGRASLDAPASDVLPDLGKMQVLTGFDADGTPQTRAPSRPITLRMLLNHTAGFSYDMWSAETLRFQKATGLPGPFSGQRAALMQPLLFDPGTRWHYSIALDWVGQFIEAVTGDDLEHVFRTRIFAPLGMIDTTFTQNDEQRLRRVGMHRRMPDGSIAPVLAERPEKTEIYLGGGGLFGTIPDYLRLTRALLAGGGPILKAETVADMARNHLGGLNVAPMLSCMPNFSQDCEFWPGMDKKWGLSFMINTEATPEGRSAGSLAWAGLSNLYFWIDVARGVTGVFGSQMMPFFDARAVTTFQTFEREIYALLDERA